MKLTARDVWAARAELCKRSFSYFLKAIDIPGAPIDLENEECEEFEFFSIKDFTAHHALLIDELQELADAEPDDCHNLMVFMPPGSAKSTYASVCFPAWLMVRKKNYQPILGSYASNLARKMGRKTRALIKSKKFLRLFPECALRADTQAADEFALLNGSEYMSGGISSGITGNRADAIIIDDPVKGREDAESETIRKKTKEGYDDDFRTRAKPHAIKLIIQTRWHEDDLSGSILPEKWNGESGLILCRDGEYWKVIRIPAQSEGEGDLLGRPKGAFLWPEWFPTSHWTFAKRISRTWASLYQGRPSPDEGALFKREWFRYYTEKPKHLNIYAASDYAVTDSAGDWTVHLIVGVDPDDNIYLLDLWREQTSSNVWIESQIDLATQWKPIIWAEEGGVIHKAIDPALTKRMRERKVYFRRETINPIHSKEARAQSISARYAMGKVYHPANAPWLADLEREMLSFPYAKHDDQVDPLSLIGRLLTNMWAARPSSPKEQSHSSGYSSASEEEGSWRI